MITVTRTIKKALYLVSFFLFCLFSACLNQKCDKESSEKKPCCSTNQSIEDSTKVAEKDSSDCEK